MWTRPNGIAGFYREISEARRSNMLHALIFEPLVVVK